MHIPWYPVPGTIFSMSPTFHKPSPDLNLGRNPKHLFPQDTPYFCRDPQQLFSRTLYTKGQGDPSVSHGSYYRFQATTPSSSLQNPSLASTHHQCPIDRLPFIMSAFLLSARNDDREKVDNIQARDPRGVWDASLVYAIHFQGVTKSFKSTPKSLEHHPPLFPTSQVLQVRMGRALEEVHLDPISDHDYLLIAKTSFTWSVFQ